MYYELALFFHIVGVLLMFAGITIETLALIELSRAQTLEQARLWLRGARVSSKLFPPAVVLIFVAGAYMAATVWHGTAWIDVGLVTLLTFAIAGPRMNGKRFANAATTAFAITTGTITPELRRQLDDPTLRTSVTMMAFAALGVIFLMVVKPDWAGALVTMSVALVIGWMTATLTLHRRPTTETTQATSVAAVEEASVR